LTTNIHGKRANKKQEQQDSNSAHLRDPFGRQIHGVRHRERRTCPML